MQVTPVRAPAAARRVRATNPWPILPTTTEPWASVDVAKHLGLVRAGGADAHDDGTAKGGVR